MTRDTLRDSCKSVGIVRIQSRYALPI